MTKEVERMERTKNKTEVSLFVYQEKHSYELEFLYTCDTEIPIDFGLFNEKEKKQYINQLIESNIKEKDVDLKKIKVYTKTPKGYITTLAYDHETKSYMDVITADFERKVAILYNKDDDEKEIRLFHEIDCYQDLIYYNADILDWHEMGMKKGD